MERKDILLIFAKQSNKQ